MLVNQSRKNAKSGDEDTVIMYPFLYIDAIQRGVHVSYHNPRFEMTRDTSSTDSSSNKRTSR